MPSPFPCSPVIRECLWKETQVEKKNVKRDILSYGDSRFDTNKSKLILEASIMYVKNAERFSGSTFA